MTKTVEQMAQDKAYELGSNNVEFGVAKDAYLAGYQAAKDEYKTKISELEIELENWKHTAIHGDEGL